MSALKRSHTALAELSEAAEVASLRLGRRFCSTQGSRPLTQHNLLLLIRCYAQDGYSAFTRQRIFGLVASELATRAAASHPRVCATSLTSTASSLVQKLEGTRGPAPMAHNPLIPPLGSLSPGPRSLHASTCAESRSPDCL